MRLTTYSDYSLRVLIYLALNQNELVTIKEMAEKYNISKNHLMKVVHNLVQTGYVTSVRGRTGGLKLAKAPHEINVGKLVRATEDDLNIAECFEKGNTTCRITHACKLKHVLREALHGFLSVLDNYTLEDLTTPQNKLMRSLELQM